MMSLKRFITLIAFLLCLITLISLALRPSPDDIAQGQPFIYIWHVDIPSRPIWAIAGFVVLFLWFFLHRVLRWLQHIGYGAVTLLVFACAIYTLLIPLLSITQTAYHLQTARTNHHIYHVFYQYEGITATTCDYVLVQCDNLGILCEQISRTPESYCLAQFAPITLQATGQGIRLTYADETLFQKP